MNKNIILKAGIIILVLLCCTWSILMTIGILTLDLSGETLLTIELFGFDTIIETGITNGLGKIMFIISVIGVIFAAIVVWLRRSKIAIIVPLLIMIGNGVCMLLTPVGIGNILSRTSFYTIYNISEILMLEQMNCFTILSAMLTIAFILFKSRNNKKASNVLILIQTFITIMFFIKGTAVYLYFADNFLNLEYSWQVGIAMNGDLASIYLCEIIILIALSIKVFIGNNNKVKSGKVSKNENEIIKQIFCPNCGNELAEDTAFCPRCGKKIESVNNNVT